MQRKLFGVGLFLLLYTSALVFGTVVLCSTGRASELSGEWATPGNAAHVRIVRCVSERDLLCGVITWLWEPIDAKGEAIRDARNPDPSLRKQPLIGLSLLKDFRHAPYGGSIEGRIYNPENGRTYDAILRLRSNDILEVKGCLLFVCDTQIWRRVESLCPTSSPAKTCSDPSTDVVTSDCHVANPLRAGATTALT